jgi:Holliday junction DNA helicase RuvA
VIGRLTGLLVERGGDGTCIVDVGGVGYEVLVPAGALGRLPANATTVTLHIHTHVREDEISLYGFATLEDRSAFKVLLGISSVGPKLALSILSHLDSRALARAIASQDRTALSGISGVGKKTVERLLLELRDKLPLSPSSAGTIAAPIAPPAAQKHKGELGAMVGALIQLGYKPSEAERAANVLAEESAGKPVELLLREALVLLSS